MSEGERGRVFDAAEPSIKCTIYVWYDMIATLPRCLSAGDVADVGGMRAAHAKEQRINITTNRTQRRRRYH